MVKEKITIEKGVKLPKKKVAELRKKPGSSNIGEYTKVSKGSFCGPSGGSARGTFPVNTKKRAKAALSYAHNAPNPSGIRSCVKRKFPSVGKSSNKK